MTVKDLIVMILTLPASDQAKIRAALANPASDGSVLDLPLGDNDADAATIRDYFKAQLSLLWDTGEAFNSKRPFGNSGWQHDLTKALVLAGKVAGKIDEDGHADGTDADEVIEAVLVTIAKL